MIGRVEPKRRVRIMTTQRDARNPYRTTAFCYHLDSLNVLGLPALGGHVELARLAHIPISIF
jgi:hypothetical protein